MEPETAPTQPEALHISKVAVGCATLATLARRQQARAAGGMVPLVTRFRPKRADELIGGSVYWIVKHKLAARQTILGFDVRAADRKTIIQLDPELVPVRALPRRAHQGWRYLADSDAPRDLSGEEDLAELPADLAAKLTALGLI
jgi:hypothetical protein